MHEKERHSAILQAVKQRPVVTIEELVALTDSSEATVRRDITALHAQNRLRRVRGGAEAVNQPHLAGTPFSVNATKNIAAKRAIAQAAVELCTDGEPIIINGGTTTYQMVHHLEQRIMPVFTNSFPIADYLLKHSKNVVTLPGGTIYREQNIILSPFENDMTQNFSAKRMFTSTQAIGPFGMMESDPLLIVAEQKLLNQAEELIVLADSSKFKTHGSLVLCKLARVAMVITDAGIEEREINLLRDAGVKVNIVEGGVGANQSTLSA
jgi:DeoR family transcriptional regulator, ulaG and ulaABCDEF operon transcriptional repressor